MSSPLSLTRILVLLLILPLALAACSRQLPQEELLERAAQSLAEGKFKAAEIDVKTALRDDPSNASGRRLLGQLRLQQRSFEEAADEFGKSLDAQPDPDVAALYAEALLGAGQAEKVLALQAEGSFNIAAENPTFMAILARAQALSGDIFAGQYTLDEAIGLAPGNAQVQLAQAVLLTMQTDNPEPALDVLRELTASKPDFADAWSFYGNLARSAGDKQLAENAYRTASELNSFRIDDRLGLVSVLMAQEKYSEALVEIDALEEIIPQHPAVNYWHALIAMSQDDNELALEQLAEVINVAPDHLPSIYLAANAHFRAGNMGSAENYLKSYLAAQPGNINARQMLASVYVRTGEADKAEQIARQLVKESPMEVKSLKILAVALTAQGLHSASADIYQELSTITPEAPEVHLALGTELTRVGEIERGIQELETAKSLDPDNAAIRSRLVLAHSARGDEPAMQRELEEYRLLVGPSDPRPDVLAGELSMRTGNEKQAAEYFSRALELDPGTIAASTGMAAVAMRQDNPDEAIAVLEAGLAASPDHQQTLINLAAVYGDHGDTDAMVATLNKAVQAEPDALEPRLQLARYHFEQGRPGEAVDLLTSVLEANERDPEVHQLLVGAFLALEQPGAAVTSGRKLVKLLPENPVALRLAAQAELANGEPAMAETYLRQALVARPSDLETRKLLVQSLMLQNKLEESSTELALMPENGSAGYKVDLARGEIELALGRPVEAETILRRAYAAAPDSKTLAYLNVALKRQGKLDESVQLGESWLESHPDDQLILRQLGPDYLAQGQEEDAVRIYETLNRLSPEDPLVMNNLAWSYRQTDPKLALDYVEKALEAAPENPAILDTKSMILMEMEEYDQALTANQQALDISKQHPQFLLSRAEILAAAGRNKDAAAIIEGLLQEEQFVGNERLEGLLVKYQAK